MNLLKQIFLRLYKQIEIHNPKNISFGTGATLSNGVILNATDGEINLGQKTRIGKYSELVSAKNGNLKIKDYTTLYSNCKVLGNVTIERYCVLATNIYMSSGNHFAFEYPELLIRVQDKLVRDKKANINKAIHIHEDVWVGNGVFISPGITIGRGAVVGAGAVVTKNVQPYEVVVGNPAKHIKNRLAFSPPSKIESGNQHDRPYFYQGFDHMSTPAKQNDKGFLLLDTGAVYLKDNLNSFIIEGFSSSKTELSVNMEDYTQKYKIEVGSFKLTLKHSKIEPSKYSILTFSTVTPASLYIKSITGNTN